MSGRKDCPIITVVFFQGQMELKETVNIWKQKGHLMSFFKETAEPKPTDFMSKFLSGQQ